ncbi:SANT/Myb_domain [Hexamita inflata]|uniref:SANT/Myb domain n=1 Tax=Hexamita inflata TaxID=28002 RepID=A0AA86P273_9EUKA|nr:SANT/Myb domain [Hexamita inflata]CAI9928796.1 SANT/Myb domain [Hexamita inflata]
MHSTQYNKWTAEETRYIISAAREYKTSKIDWIAIQALVPHRTVQQCKSFYNNTVKEYDIYYLLKHHGLQAVAQKALYYLLTDNLNSCQDARKKAYFNNLQVDALINIFQVLAGNSSFKYNVELLQLAREVIIVYKQEVGLITEELQLGYSATFQNQPVSKQQLEQLDSLMASINCDDLFLKLSAVITDTMRV